MKNLVLTAFTLLLFVSQTNAQKAFEGTVNFTLEYSGLSDDMAELKTMLAQTAILKIKEKKSRMEQKSALGYTIVITNEEANEITTLMNMMGNKVAIKKNFKEVKKGAESTMEINYLDEVKELAGYQCKKAEIRNEGAENVIVVYYTEEIKAPKIDGQFKDLKGFPMQYEMEEVGLKIIMTASSVEKGEIADVEFSVPDDYEVMTFDQYKSSMQTQIQAH